MGGAVKITRTDMSAQDLRCAAKRTRDGWTSSLFPDSLIIDPMLSY